MQAIKLPAYVSSDMESGAATVRTDYLENACNADSQYYPLNWTTQQDRNNPTFSAVRTIDRDNRYVFGLCDAYKTIAGPFAIAKEVAEWNDFKQPVTFRNYARFWPNQDVNFFSNELFKNTTFVALALPYTFVRPVIGSINDTVSLTERLFSQFAPARNLLNFGRTDLSSALSGYQVKGFA